MSFRSIQHHQHTEDEKKTLKNKLENELFNSTIKFIFIIHERLCYSPNVVIVFAVIAVGVSFLRRYCLMNTHCHNRKTIISVKLATLCSCVHSVCVLLCGTIHNVLCVCGSLILFDCSCCCCFLFALLHIFTIIAICTLKSIAIGGSN